MAMRGFICVLTFISAVTAAGKLERPSMGLIAELLRSPPQDVRNHHLQSAALIPFKFVCSV